MSKLILTQCLLAVCSAVSAFDPLMTSLFDEVAEQLDHFEANYHHNAKDTADSIQIPSINRPVAGMIISQKQVANSKSKKPPVLSKTSKNKSIKNRKRTHVFQRDMVVPTTLIQSMSYHLLLRQIKEGCRAKQYTFARQQFGYLLLRHQSKAIRTNRRRMRDPRARGVPGIIAKIKSLIGDDDFANMMGIKKRVTLTFVIDTTGSMMEEIQVVKKFVAEIVKTTKNYTKDYILSPFNDLEADRISKELHSGPKHFFMNETKSFWKAVDALTVNGGGDCPEMSIRGMKDVFSHGFSEESPMFVFTDAGVKDFKLAEGYKFVADIKKPRTNIFISKDSVCISPKDIQDYRSLVSDHGGVVMSFLSTNIELIHNGLTGTVMVPVYKRKKKRSVGSKDKDEFYWDVDDTIDNMEVAVMSESASEDIDIFNVGTWTLERKPQSSGKGSLLTIANPSLGRYKALVPSDTNTVVRVKGSSDRNLDFEHFFVLKVRSGFRFHYMNSLHPVRGFPGSMVVTINNLDRTFQSSIRLSVVESTALSHLGRCTLKPDGKQSNRFQSECKVPEIAFRLILSGRTKRNKPFYRLSPVIRMQPFLVYPISLPRGSTVSHNSSIPVIFSVNTLLGREELDIKVSPKDAIIRQPRFVTVVPGRASLFLIKTKAAKNAKRGELQNIIVKATGRISGLTAHRVIQQCVK